MRYTKSTFILIWLIVIGLMVTGCDNPADEPDYRSFTVTFDKNGGDTEAVPKSMMVKEPVNTLENLPAPPSRAGYAFAGWNRQRDGSEGEFTDASTVDASFTVYACWTRVYDTVFTTFENIREYLAAAEANTVDNPLPLTVKMDLGAMTEPDSNWRKLLALLHEYEVYVELDLSPCIIDGGEGAAFNPYFRIDTGKRWITSLVLPNAAQRISHFDASVYYFDHFINMKKISGTGITTVGGYLFLNTLEEADFPNLTTINADGFRNATGIKTITLPASITSISTNAFTGCTDITFVISGTGLLSAILDGKALVLDGALAAYPSASGSVALPAVVTAISPYVFQDNTGITAISMPSVTKIENNAFNGCTNLSLVNMPAGLTTIENNAFVGCAELVEIILPANLETLGNYAFWNCTKLAAITLPAGITAIPTAAFASCTSLNSITMQGVITSIGGNAFLSNAFTAFTIPASVQTIAANAFSSCASLGSVTFEATPRTGTASAAGFTSIANVNSFPGSTASGSSLYTVATNTTSGGIGTYTTTTPVTTTSVWVKN